MTITKNHETVDVMYSQQFLACLQSRILAWDRNKLLGDRGDTS